MDRRVTLAASLAAMCIALAGCSGGGAEHRAIVTCLDAMKEERGSRSSPTGIIYDVAAEEGKLRVEYEVAYTEGPVPIIAYSASTCEYDPEAKSAESAGGTRAASEPSDSDVVEAWNEKNGLKWAEKNFGYDPRTLEKENWSDEPRAG